jgi:hypothetical protein
VYATPYHFFYAAGARNALHFSMYKRTMPHATVMMFCRLQLLLLPFVMTRKAAGTSYGSAVAYATGSSTATATTLSPITHTINVAKASLDRVLQTQSFVDQLIQGGFTFDPDVTLANAGDYVGNIFLVY